MIHFDEGFNPKENKGKVLKVDFTEDDHQITFHITISEKQPLENFYAELFDTQETAVMSCLIRKGWVGKDGVIKVHTKMLTVGKDNDDGTYTYTVGYILADEAKEKTSTEELNKKEKIALAKELSENGEVFPFSGIEQNAYQKIKADEEEYPGMGTPIDELMQRYKDEGMKVVLGAHPESGNVFILPSQSDDIENDMVFPRQLQINGAMDERLKRLILMDRG